jgi:ABC-type dipeptide/oligopeptide/nickel transport system permease component
MIEFTLLLVFALAILGAIVARARKSKFDHVLHGLGRYIFILLAGWLGFSLLFALYILFDDLESGKMFSYQLLLRWMTNVLRLLTIGLGVAIVLVWVPTRFSKR